MRKIAGEREREKERERKREGGKWGKASFCSCKPCLCVYIYEYVNRCNLLLGF